MTLVHVDHDEWWPVPELERAPRRWRILPDDDDDAIDLPEDLVKRFEEANAAFATVSDELTRAAARAGHPYWRTQYPNERPDT